MSMPRAVGKRKKSRVMGKAQLLGRPEYEALALDAKVELIRVAFHFILPDRITL